MHLSTVNKHTDWLLFTLSIWAQMEEIEVHSLYIRIEWIQTPTRLPTHILYIQESIQMLVSGKIFRYMVEYPLQASDRICGVPGYIPRCEWNVIFILARAGAHLSSSTSFEFQVSIYAILAKYSNETSRIPDQNASCWSRSASWLVGLLVASSPWEWHSRMGWREVGVWDRPLSTHLAWLFSKIWYDHNLTDEHTHKFCCYRNTSYKYDVGRKLSGQNRPTI